MARPVIGITCYVEPAEFGPWQTTASLIPHDYVAQVERAGGQPVLLPPVGDPAGLLARIDALVVAGGGDVDPARYGAEPHPRTGGVRPDRDRAEAALTRVAVETRVPLLGICRGLQVLNVVRGGTLYQHLPDLLGHTRHGPAPGVYGRLPVRLAPGSRVAAALGRTEIDAAHHHHQAADRLGTGLRATAWSVEPDGRQVIEAVELHGHPFAVAVQWHPETHPDGALFDALVAATVRTG